MYEICRYFYHLIYVLAERLFINAIENCGLENDTFDEIIIDGVSKVLGKFDADNDIRFKILIINPEREFNRIGWLLLLYGTNEIS